MAQAPQDAAAQAAPATELSLLDRILDDGRLARGPSSDARDRARSLVGEFVDRVLSKTGTVSDDVTQRITDCIADIDDLISAQRPMPVMR